MSIGPYWLGDVPSNVTVYFDANGEDVDAYSGVDVRVTNPLGVETALVGTFDPEVSEITIAFPEESLLTVQGIYSLRLALTSEDLWRTLPVVLFVVQVEDGWHTLESARREWLDAPALDDQLYGQLVAAKEQCLAFAPALAVDAPVPMRYRQAQLMQTRNLWNSPKSDPNLGGFGGEDMPRTIFPMEWSVKNLLRPKRGVPLVG